MSHQQFYLNSLEHVQDVVFGGKFVTVTGHESNQIPTLMSWRQLEQSCAPPSSVAIAQSFSPLHPPTPYDMPYETSIQGGLHPGKTIIVKGCVIDNAERFVIELCSGSYIAFHFNPRFTQGVVVWNSLLQGVWGTEEESGGDMPFSRGQPFKVTIKCEAHCYRIMVNDVEKFTYNHRYFLLEEIDILKVKHDVSLTSVTV